MLTKEKHFSPNSRGELVSLIRSKSFSAVWDQRKKLCIRICSDCAKFLTKDQLIKIYLVIINSICQTSVGFRIVNLNLLHNMGCSRWWGSTICRCQQWEWHNKCRVLIMSYSRKWWKCQDLWKRWHDKVVVLPKCERCNKWTEGCNDPKVLLAVHSFLDKPLK